MLTCRRIGFRALQEVRDEQQRPGPCGQAGRRGPRPAGYSLGLAAARPAMALSISGKFGECKGRGRADGLAGRTCSAGCAFSAAARCRHKGGDRSIPTACWRCYRASTRRSRRTPGATVARCRWSHVEIMVASTRTASSRCSGVIGTVSGGSSVSLRAQPFVRRPTASGAAIAATTSSPSGSRYCPAQISRAGPRGTRTATLR
jgi:hypothetical protein